MKRPRDADVATNDVTASDCAAPSEDQERAKRKSTSSSGKSAIRRTSDGLILPPLYDALGIDKLPPGFVGAGSSKLAQESSLTTTDSGPSSRKSSITSVGPSEGDSVAQIKANLPATGSDSPARQVTSPTTHVGSPPTHLGSPLAHMGSGMSFLGNLGSGTSMRFVEDGSGSSYRGSVDRDVSAVATTSEGKRSSPPLQAEARRWLNRRRTGQDISLSFSDLQIVSCIGTGTFGRVLLVKLRTPRPDLPAYCALKVLNKSALVRQGQIEHSNWERAILAGIQHPGIVNLLCTFQDERNLYLLLEFVQGGELFSHLRRAVRFSPDVARFFAANVVLVLEYLHSKHIVYRDLKPENLLLDNQGYLKLCDMGFSKLVWDRTFTLCGTPHFLSPESIRGTGHGTAADWWSLGVLLFEMLCGYPPFFDSSPIVIYEKILAGHVSFPPYVDPLAKDLIKRLLTADLSRRLGNLRNGAHDVKLHPWFAGVDWESVYQRKIMPPIVPGFEDPGDASYFERYPPTNLRDLPALERAHLQHTLGAGYKEPRIEADPYKLCFEVRACP